MPGRSAQSKPQNVKAIHGRIAAHSLHRSRKVSEARNHGLRGFAPLYAQIDGSLHAWAEKNDERGKSGCKPGNNADEIASRVLIYTDNDLAVVFW